MDFLTSKGWTVALYPVVITHSGLITSTAAQALAACGVPNSDIAATLRKIARHTLSYNLKFRSARRALDAALPAEPPDPH
jgi:hypothetical protein